MSITATGRCFYCSNVINREGRHVYATIRHHYANGQTRDTDRNFHMPCFEKFEAQGGRPWNPSTEYEVLESEEMNMPAAVRR